MLLGHMDYKYALNLLDFQFLLGCYQPNPNSLDTRQAGFQFLLGCYSRYLRFLQGLPLLLSIPFGMLLIPVHAAIHLHYKAFNSFWDAT